MFYHLLGCTKGGLNPCPAELIKKSHPFLIISQSDYSIKVVDIVSHTEWQTVQIKISSEAN